MNSAEHLEWETLNCDDFPEEKLNLIDDFFNTEFPEVFGESKISKILKWKISNDNPEGTGFLTIAKWNGKVIGLASATKRKISIGNTEYLAVETGDTFTANQFRKSGRCRSPLKFKNDASRSLNTEYLAKSVFGRTLYETIERAKDSGIEIFFGFPNQLSSKAYRKRFGFENLNESKMFSFYWFGAKTESKLKCLAAMQCLITSIILYFQKIIKTRYFQEINFEETKEKIKLFQLQNDSSIVKNDNYLDYRYFKHPTNKYKFLELKNKNNFTTNIIVYKIIENKNRLQIVDNFYNESKKNDLLLACLYIYKKNYKNIRLQTSWIVAQKNKPIRNFLCGVLWRNNVPPIFYAANPLLHEEIRNKLIFTNLADSDNG